MLTNQYKQYVDSRCVDTENCLRPCDPSWPSGTSLVESGWWLIIGSRATQRISGSTATRVTTSTSPGKTLGSSAAAKVPVGVLLHIKIVND